jgi:Flp pilus assembly protein TadG
MGWGFFSDQKRFIRREHGGVAVEFAIIVPILVLLVFGIIDFGHAWYMRHLISDASRDGARYGTRFTEDGNDNRILPKNLSPSIDNYILNSASENGGSSGLGLRSLLPGNASPSVTCTGAASTETNSANLVGEDLIITVSATKTWFVLGKLIPGLGDSTAMRVTTTMTCD